MLAKQVRIDQIEIRVNTGEVYLRLAKEITDGDTIIFSEPHRVSIAPGASLDKVRTLTNEHLTATGWVGLSTDPAWADIKSILPRFHASEKIAAWQAREEEQTKRGG